MKGKVVLVGAGPGDKNLLTLDAFNYITNADVVVYDRLVSKDIMALVPKTAQLIDVGKNVGNHIVPQDQINEILVREYNKDKLVVRLKGGDPFLFGRGGEELELLIQNNIPFKVVPGITSAMAVPLYAGIPVTHRDFCASVHIISGHSAKSGALPIDYDALSRLKGTLVFLMSVASIPTIAQGLLEAGMDKDTEVAFIENGTRKNQRRIITTLEKCGEDIKKYKVVSPSIIVVGKVCTLADKYDWFTKQELYGCKVLVTRQEETPGKLVEKLESKGADVKWIPLIKTSEMDFNMDLEKYSTLIFTSAAGVNSFFKKLSNMGKDSRALFGKKIAVVGSMTGKAVEKYGIKPDFIPTEFSGKALAEEMTEKLFITQFDKVGMFRALDGAKEITEVLDRENIDYDDIPVYKTEPISAEINPDDYDYICFTSGSGVRSFVNSVGENFDFSKVNALCIGKQTSKEAEKVNMNIYVSKEATMDSMVERLAELW